MEGTQHHKISVWAWIKNNGVSGLTRGGFGQAVGLYCVDIIPLVQNMPNFSWSVSADNYSGGSKAIVKKHVAYVGLLDWKSCRHF